MLSAESLYAKVPIPLQNLACGFEGWRSDRTRYGSSADAVSGEVFAREGFSPEAIREFRDGRLRTLLQHAARSVPYYGQMWENLGIDVCEIRGLDDLSSLPMLRKDDVQDAIDQLSSSAVPRRDCRLIHTSGTTGRGLRFNTTVRAIQEQWATYWRYWSWHGITRDQLCAFFGGRSVVPANQVEPPFWRSARSQRRLLFSAHHLSHQNLPYYISELRRSRPPWIHGYPSLVALVAAHLVETGGDLGYEVRWVTTGAENLTPHQRALIEKGFGVTPRQHYGSTEAVAQFSECPEGRLHIDEDFAAVEFVPGDCGSCRILGTNLTNPATPLVRYEIGDVGRLASEGCGCGRPGRIVAEIDGGEEDYVVTAQGARVAALNHVFKDMVRIREAQLVQQRAGEVTICVVVADGFDATDEATLRREALKRFGDDMNVDVEYATALPRTPTGKLRLVVSTVGAADRVAA